MGFDMGVFPFLLGMLWCCGKKTHGWCSVYVRGYVMMWTLQWAVIVFSEKSGYTFYDTLALWNQTGRIATAMCAVACLVFHKSIFREIKVLWKHGTDAFERLRAPILAFMLILVFVLAVIYPSPQDDVPEIVNLTIKTDSMYRIQPYTKEVYADNSLKAFSPIEVVYAIWAERADVDSTTMIHMATPVFLILLFVCVGWMISSLFCESIAKRKVFVILWMLTYSVAPLCVRNLAVGVLQNPWNGTTILNGTLLPMIMYHGVNTIKNRHCEVLFALVTLVAAQMALAKGALLGLLMFAACAVSFLIYRWAERIRNAGNHN
jgi:hypothetical protein